MASPTDNQRFLLRAKSTLSAYSSLTVLRFVGQFDIFNSEAVNNVVFESKKCQKSVMMMTFDDSNREKLT